MVTSLLEEAELPQSSSTLLEQDRRRRQNQSQEMVSGLFLRVLTILVVQASTEQTRGPAPAKVKKGGRRFS